MSAEVARALWDDMMSCSTPEEFHDLPIRDMWELIEDRYKPCVDFFWNNMWKEFMEDVKNKISEGK